MDALNLTQSISEAKREIERSYQNGEIDKEERDFQLSHILGF